LRGERVPRALPRQIAGRRFTAARRHGKYLLLDLNGGWTLLSHLGMSGRWLFHPDPPPSGWRTFTRAFTSTTARSSGSRIRAVSACCA
jgi:formamidopyrimidine-DNA glycosylase